METEPKIPESQDELFTRLKKRATNFYLRVGQEEYMNWVYRCTQRIQAKHPDFRKYKLWHLIARSTTDDTRSPFFDFTGEFSIQKMIEGLPSEDEKTE